MLHLRDIMMHGVAHHDATVIDVRTTVTLDPDVAARLAELQEARGLSFKDAVNETLRRGLGAAPGGSPYRMPVRRLGMRPGIDIDRIRDEISRLDDERLGIGTDSP